MAKEAKVKKEKVKKEKKPKKEKAPKEKKEKAPKKAKGAKGEKEPKEAKKGGRVKIIAIGAVCVVLFGAIVFSALKLIDSRKPKDAELAEADGSVVAGEVGEAGENAEAADPAGDEEGGKGKAPKEKKEKAPKKEKYVVNFDPGDTKTIYSVDDKDGDPRYEVTVHSVRQLSAEDKSQYGLSKETGRLGQIELDVRLIDPSYDWNLYNRRVADAKGNWLDEIKAIYDDELLDKGLVDSQTLIFRLPGDSAVKDEKVSLSVYTSTWNDKKKKADGVCDVGVGPPPPPPPRESGRGGGSSAPVVQNLDTEFGNWNGNTYTSAQLDMQITLPEDWRPQLESSRESSGNKSLEGTAVRNDGKATLQLTVDKQIGSMDEEGQLAFFKDLLSRAVGDFVISDPFHQTIAGKDYLGLAYSSAGVDYQVYFHKAGGNLVEVAMHYPLSESETADILLNNMKAIN